MDFSGVRLIEFFAFKGSKGYLEVMQNGETRCYIIANMLYACFSKDPFDLEEDTLDVLEVIYQMRGLNENDLKLLEYELLENYKRQSYHHLIFIGNGSLHLIFQQFIETDKLLTPCFA